MGTENNDKHLNFNQLGEAYFDLSNIAAQGGSFKYALRGKPYKSLIIETMPDGEGNQSGQINVFLGSAVSGHPWRSVLMGGGRGGPAPSVDFITLIPSAGAKGIVCITLSTEIWGTFFKSPSTVTEPTLEELSDVSIVAPTNGQVLEYQSGEWVNGTPSSNLSYDAIVEAEPTLTQFWPMNDTGTPTHPNNVKGTGVLTTASLAYGAAGFDLVGETAALITAVVGAGITAPNNLLPNLTTGPWTLEFCIMSPGTGTGSTPSQQILFTPDHNQVAELFTVASSDGTLGLYTGSNNGLFSSALGTKKHIVINMQATGPIVVVYVNGSFYCEATPAAITAGQTMGIGCHPTLGDPMQGRIGKIAIYSSSLTLAQIASHVEALGL